MPTDDVWRGLGSLGERWRYPRGKRILRQGEDGRFVLLIENGTVKVVVRMIDGAQKVVALRGPGDLLGETSVVLGAPRNADVYAITPCTGVVVPSAPFLRYVQDSGRSFELYKLELERRIAVELERSEMRTLPLEARLARKLLGLVRLTGSHDLRGISHRLLAELVGVTRGALPPVLGPLRESGALVATRERIRVQQPDALVALARIE